MPKIYPPEIKQKAINLYILGLSLATAGEEVGATAFTVQKWLKEEGIDRRPANPTDEATESLKRIAQTMYENYHSTAEIALIVNRSQSTVTKWLKQKKVKLRKAGDWSIAIMVPLTPALKNVPEDQRRQFCLDAIEDAARKLKVND